jgi:hypothetical protein
VLNYYRRGFTLIIIVTSCFREVIIIIPYFLEWLFFRFWCTLFRGVIDDLFWIKTFKSLLFLFIDMLLLSDFYHLLLQYFPIMLRLILLHCIISFWLYLVMRAFELQFQLKYVLLICFIFLRCTEMHNISILSGYAMSHFWYHLNCAPACDMLF